VFFAGP
uniref:Cycloamanide A n=1 Tax=Amanita phalloides TaxID=67723 RepID=CYAA_AMAPH|nr:RecName: Full=Cycloamanide A; Short=CyA A; Short=Cyl A [Amanita phalloides]